MNSTFFRQKSHSGFSKPAYHKKNRHFSFVGKTPDASGTQATLQDFPDPGAASGGDVPFSDSTFEVDFSSLPCDKLLELINQIESMMQAGRLTAVSAPYYESKLTQLQYLYSQCNTKPTTGGGGGGSTPTGPEAIPTTTPTTSGGGGGGTPATTTPAGIDPGLVPITPITINNNTPVSSGGTPSTGGGSPLSSFFGGGAGGGAGAGGTTKKKFNWWLIIAIALAGTGAYMTYKQKN